MSTGARRGQFAWAFVSRQLTSWRRSSRSSDFEATIIVMDNPSPMPSTQARNLGRSTEMVALENSSSSSDSSAMSADDARPNSPPDRIIEASRVPSNRLRRMGSDIVELMPFWNNTDDDPPIGDDPTFQQLLCLAGVFCGPLMYLIGGILFCVIPREHRQTRRWALFNLILAIMSFIYLASTGSIDEMQRPVAGIHMLKAEDHLPFIDSDYISSGGSKNGSFNLSGNRLTLGFSQSDWQSHWTSDSDMYSRLKLDPPQSSNSEIEDPRLWVFGTHTDFENCTVSTRDWIEVTGPMYLRTAMLSSRALRPSLQRSLTVRQIDCSRLQAEGKCDLEGDESNGDVSAIDSYIECSTHKEGTPQWEILLWRRFPETDISPESSTLKFYLEDTFIVFNGDKEGKVDGSDQGKVDAKTLWCHTKYMLTAAPAHVYISTQTIFT